MDILLTADLHLGKSYSKFAAGKRYAEARIEAFRNIIKIGNEKGCEILVIAGDLFDKKSIPPDLHKMVSRILGEFPGDVLILPGNHDFYNPEQDKLWKDFEALSPPNVRVLRDKVPFPMGDIVFYPCPCNAKYSKANALGWLSSYPYLDQEKWNIGIAHGTVVGQSYDLDEKYFSMTEKELYACKMDMWFIGHTHVPFVLADNRILNPGTHQQTDIADSSCGEIFIVSLKENKAFSVQKYRTGVLDFVKREVHLDFNQELENTLRQQVQDLSPKRTSLRITLTGFAGQDEYSIRKDIYERVFCDFISYEVEDSKLNRAITSQMIDQETVKGSTINLLLHRYENSPELLNLAFDKVLECIVEETGDRDRKRG